MCKLKLGKDMSTCHMCQTTKLHLILASNVKIEIGKGHVDMSKVQNYKTTPDFATRYINFIYVFDASYVQTTKLQLILTSNVKFEIQRP